MRLLEVPMIDGSFTRIEARKASATEWLRKLVHKGVAAVQIEGGSESGTPRRHGNWHEGVGGHRVPAGGAIPGFHGGLGPSSHIKSDLRLEI